MALQISASNTVGALTIEVNDKLMITITDYGVTSNDDTICINEKEWKQMKKIIDGSLKIVKKMVDTKDEVKNDNS